MNLATIVQHHPSREELLPGLLARLPAGAFVVTDPDPDDRISSPWRTYRECLRSIPDDATHALIVQDDTVPHPDFPQVVPRCVEARPDRIICFFVASNPARGARAMMEAARMRRAWAELSPLEFLPVIATCWPAELARAFLTWADRNARAGARSDDGIAGRWIRHHSIAPVATIPCLVEHPDVEPSLIGKQAMAGANRARVSILPPEGADILSIDWR